mmetsp:Transcript_9377/g.14474  ORF Transcript_9377/g.14474 Transcript_9377/m.14474 type:complete len:217 (+) Transcript_9377:565-1215(+)
MPGFAAPKWYATRTSPPSAMASERVSNVDHRAPRTPQAATSAVPRKAANIVKISHSPCSNRYPNERGSEVQMTLLSIFRSRIAKDPHIPLIYLFRRPLVAKTEIAITKRKKRTSLHNAIKATSVRVASFRKISRIKVAPSFTNSWKVAITAINFSNPMTSNSPLYASCNPAIQSLKRHTIAKFSAILAVLSGKPKRITISKIKYIQITLFGIIKSE